MTVRTVGIRELKNRLSHYVAEVRRGQIVLVTDRATVVAELRPPARGRLMGLEPGLERMAERGELAEGLAHDPSLYERLGPCGPPHLAARLIGEERGGQ